MHPELDPVAAQNTACDDRGLTLLELVVAIAVLAMGTLTVLRAVDQSRVGIGGERARLLAGLVADNRAEELRLPGAGTLPDRVDMGGLQFLVQQDLRATAGGLRQAVITVRLTGAEAQETGQPVGPGALRVTWLAAPNATPGAGQ